jgi:hypothetical protein
MSAGVGIRRFHRWVSMAFTPGRATLQFPHALAAQCGWMREGGAQPIVIYGQATRQSRRRIASLPFACVAKLHGTQGA